MNFQNVSPKMKFLYLFMNYRLSDVTHNSVIIAFFCNFYWPLITTRPATIHFSQAAQACNHHGVERTVAVLHWPRHQWVASPAGMCRVVQQQGRHTQHCFSMNLYNLCVWHCFFLCLLRYREHISLCSFLGHPVPVTLRDQTTRYPDPSSLLDLSRQWPVSQLSHYL